jgi:hypothetical protein
MRVLIWGRRLWSIHQGGIHFGSPSSLMRQVQPFVGSRCGDRHRKVRLQTLR